MGCMFNQCSSLTSLPDISKWDTSNIENMRCLFDSCKSLISLPDISKWNTNNVTNMCNMFYLCKSLISLPNISKWNTKNVIDMNALFYQCSLLKSLPDISKWNTNNYFDIIGLFDQCSSLKFLPDISKQNNIFDIYDNILPEIDNENNQKKQNIKIIKEGYIKKKHSFLHYRKRYIILDNSPRIILKTVTDEKYCREIPLSKKCKIIIIENNCFDLITPDKTYRFKGNENDGNDWARLIANTIKEYI